MISSNPVGAVGTTKTNETQTDGATTAQGKQLPSRCTDPNNEQVSLHQWYKNIQDTVSALLRSTINKTTTLWHSFVHLFDDIREMKSAPEQNFNLNQQLIKEQKSLLQTKQFDDKYLPKVLDFVAMKEKRSTGENASLQSDFTRNRYMINDQPLKRGEAPEKIQQFLQGLKLEQACIVEPLLTQSLTHGLACNHVICNTPSGKAESVTYHVSMKGNTVVIDLELVYQHVDMLSHFTTGVREIIEDKNVAAVYTAHLEVGPNASITRSTEKENSDTASFNDITLHGRFETYKIPTRMDKILNFLKDLFLSWSKPTSF